MVGCFDTRRTTNNTFGWPIERLYAAIDLQTRTVIEVVDNGAVPINTSDQNFNERDVSGVRDARNPTLLTQPTGASFQMDRNEVRWGKWRFHVRVDPRVGPVISLARWQAGSGPRSVLYQGFLDVDGTSNTFQRHTYQKIQLPSSPRRGVYVVKPETAETEKAGQVDQGHGIEKLLIVNEDKSNRVGNPTGYELLYANHGAFLLDPSDFPAKRARFLEHDVWVTPYSPSELYGAGDHIFGSREAAGLPVWTQKNRAIRRTDLVLWANISLHHLTRAEDQPVMPTLWHSFTLRPFNFLDRNPALDLPSEPPSPANRR